MAAFITRPLLAVLVLLNLFAPAAAVEVCKVVDLQLVTQTGEFFLAVTFLGLGVTTVVFVLMAFKAAHEKRKFYFATCFATAISTFAYYAMLSGQGWLITPNCRQLFYVRYLEWFFSTPLILLDLGMIAGADVGLLAAILGAQMLLVFGGFMASISSGHIKWLWFVLSLMVFAAVLFVMIRGFRKLIERSHPAIVEVYSKCSWLSAITWSLYPVVFIFSVGTGDWSPNFEIMIYGVLDILSKSVFGFVLLLSHEGLDRITNFKSFAPINEAPMNYGGVGGQAPVESYI